MVLVAPLNPKEKVMYCTRVFESSTRVRKGKERPREGDRREERRTGGEWSPGPVVDLEYHFLLKKCQSTASRTTLVTNKCTEKIHKNVIL